MTCLIKSVAAISTILVFAAAPVATAQTSPELIGTWALVSSVAEQGGSKTDTFGPNPKGTLMFGNDGHYTLVFVRSDLPKVVSNNRLSETPDESRAIAQGTMAHFGTYTVVEADKVVVFHIERSSFPNWDGAEQRRAFTLKGDELIYTSPGSTGAAAQIVMRRVK